MAQRVGLDGEEGQDGRRRAAGAKGERGEEGFPHKMRPNEATMRRPDEEGLSPRSVWDFYLKIYHTIVFGLGYLTY